MFGKQKRKTEKYLCVEASCWGHGKQKNQTSDSNVGFWLSKFDGIGVLYSLEETTFI